MAKSFKLHLSIVLCEFNSCISHYTDENHPINEWRNGHCSNINMYCEKQGVLDANNDIDRYDIGIHLYREHGLSNYETFNQHVKFTILENCMWCVHTFSTELWISEM